MQEEDNKSPEKQVQLNKNRKVILGILGIPVLIIILSSVLYYLVESKAVDLGTVNNGELITPPLRFSEIELKTSVGEKYNYFDNDPKWSFVVIADRDCSNSCERMLYIARQSIIALGKKMGHVRLTYISTDGVISDALKRRFDEQYIGIEPLISEQSNLYQLFAKTNLNPLANKQFFVVDPQGWLMMRYVAENTEQETLNGLGKAIVKDMKRLIK